MLVNVMLPINVLFCAVPYGEIIALGTLYTAKGEILALCLTAGAIQNKAKSRHV